jgi:dTDP-4-amino-4,6-dideoxygalactose transaminase
MTIPFLRPRLPRPEAWIPILEESYGKHWFSNFGPVHDRFKSALESTYVQAAREAIPTANCTVGLAATLCALDVKGSVAVPSFTFAASVQAIRMAGCEPVFVDADPSTWHVSLPALRYVIETQRIAAVMAVRSFGFCFDLSPVAALCREASIPLIVDSAAALGGRFASGPAVGSQGDAEVFSMHATKVFAVGEGGVVMIRSDFAPRVRSAINFGFAGDTLLERGFNGKLSEVHCSIGLSMLDAIDAEIAARSSLAQWYGELLAGSGLQLPGDDVVGRPPWQTYPVLMPSEAVAERVVADAAAAGIQLRRYYRPALHRAYGRNSECPDLPVSDHLAQCMVCFRS